MGFPNFENKHAGDSIWSPQDLMDYIRKRGVQPQFDPPKGVIFSYQRTLMDYVVANHKVNEVKGFAGQMYLLGETDNQIAILGNFGIGAPAAVIQLERLISFGVDRFISVGHAGGLQKNIGIGDLVVCDRAIRDEGTSHHYLKPSKYAYASKEMTQSILACLDRLEISYHVGASWTVDAAFRETVAEARQYQEEGVATVDMEASALFAVAQYRNVEMGSIFTISDSLADLVWQPSFHSDRLKVGLESLYGVAVHALQEQCGG